MRLPGIIEDWVPGSDDHYTPAWVFETMGLTFDLDVAAPPGGVGWIPADRYYTVVDDGLSQEWFGLVWCNPPFSDMASWARRWVTHSDGVLMACVSKASWPSEVFGASDVVWFPRRSHMDFETPWEGVTKTVSYLIFVAGRGAGAVGVRRLVAHGGQLMVPV